MEHLKNITLESGLTEKRINKAIKHLKDNSPERENEEIEGYKIIGQWWWANGKFLFEQDGKMYSALVRTQGGNSQIVVNTDPIEVDIVNLGDITYDPSIFIPLKSNTPLDFVFSKKGGIMPATNYIIVGDPGVGKSTLSIEFAAQIQKANPDKKVLFISAEMSRVDMYEYLERFEDWKGVPSVFMAEFEEGRYKETIESIYNQGWDFIVQDSFAEIVDAVKEDFNMSPYSGNQKMSSTGAEKWLIDRFVENNAGKNVEKKYTAFLSIQQVTKGGNFVGSNKLKHNTTGMIELRYTRTGERKIEVTKNRRGFDYQDLHFVFNEDKTKAPIEYDVDRIEREKELAHKMNAERDEIMNDERKLNALFGIKEGDELDEMEEAIETEVEIIE